ncbi:Fibronectin type III, partial [Trinorchestia longiramus]
SESAPLLHYQFIEQTIQPGQSVSLKCAAVGNPVPTLTWLLNGLPVHRSDRVLVGEQPGARGRVVGHVNITNSRVDDGGAYRCIASNRAGKVSHTANLNIYGDPTARHTASLTAVAGEPLDLHCPVAGYPLQAFLWTKDGVTLSGSEDNVRLAVTGVLSLRSARKPADSGLYSCTASVRQERSASAAVQVTVLIPPRIEHFSFREGLSEGMRTRVVCGVYQGDQPLKLAWLRDGQPLRMSGQGRSTQVKDIDSFSSVLTLGPLSLDHVGRYSCRASNSAATVEAEANLKVNVAPSWLVAPEDVTVSRGRDLTLHCRAQGEPVPTVTWKRKIARSDEFVALGSGGGRSPRVTQLNNGSLFFEQIHPSHGEDFMCIAKNTVGEISKTVTISVTSAPYFEEEQSQVSTRAGESVELTCRVRGDPVPTVQWVPPSPNMRHLTRHHESTVEEDRTTVLSVLSIMAVLATDAGVYSCTAANVYGRNTLDTLLVVHEPPSSPHGLRVLTQESRSVRIIWAVPGDAADAYNVQYRSLDSRPWSADSGSSGGRRGGAEAPTEGGAAGGSSKWDTSEGEVTVSVREAREGVLLSNLLPATEYLVRVIATNQLGRSPPSEELRLITKGEKPEAPPRGVTAEALGPSQVKVTWRAPPAGKLHGPLTGHFLGWAASAARNRISNAVQYNFTTIEHASPGLSSPGEGPHLEHNGARETDALWSTVLGNLRPSTAYTIVVKAYNREGAGPMSPPVTVNTMEDAPSAPPREVRCSALSSDRLQVSWGAPDPKHHNGQIQGYRVEYELWESWQDEGTLHRSQTVGQTIVLKGLEAATNYSVRVRAYTQAGDGPWAEAIACLTDEDVPGRPLSVRGIVSGKKAFIVSWAPPARPGGRLTAYKVTWRSAGSAAGQGRSGTTSVPGTATWTQIEGVEESLVEVEVSAATRVGEGPASSSRVTLTTIIAASIYSFGSEMKVRKGQDVTLLCHHVGEPVPRLAWEHNGRRIVDTDNPAVDDASDRRKLLQGNGRLLVQDSQRKDSGNYTCSVTNIHGSDRITHSLTVIVPPAAPLVLASSSSESAVRVRWKVSDTGGAPLSGFTVYYRKDHGPWTQVAAHRRAREMDLTDLDCGSRYHVYLVSRNQVGLSPASDTAVVKTLGGAPVASSLGQFLQANSSTVVVYPESWIPQGCPISHFLIEYRPHNQAHWLQENSSPQQRDDSKEDQERDIKESFVNRDGKNNVEHRDQFYATIRKIPPRESQQSDQIPENPEDIYPYATFQLPEPPPDQSIPMLSLYHQRPEKKTDTYGKTERRSNHVTRSGRPQQPQPQQQQLQQQRGHARNRSRSLGDSEDYETLGSETETEHAISSRTESSNQLDDMSTLRDHGLIYARGPVQDLQSGVETVYGPKPKTLHREKAHKDKTMVEETAFQNRIHHNLLYHAGSSSPSPEPSPTTQRKSFPRRNRPR